MTCADPARPLLLVTRPQQDAEPLAMAARELGYRPLIAPMLIIRPNEGASVDLDGVGGLLFSSANGVREFCRRLPVPDLPVFAVGPITAACCREAGFRRIVTAGGDVAHLAAAVRAHFRPQDGVLFHAAGTHVAGDLQTLLADGGYRVRRVSLYSAQPATGFSPSCAAALAAGEVRAAMFFSPRTAQVFLDLTDTDYDAMRNATRNAVALALSPAVAAVLETGDWRRILTARRPVAASLLDKLAEILPILKAEPTG